MYIAPEIRKTYRDFIIQNLNLQNLKDNEAVTYMQIIYKF